MFQSFCASFSCNHMPRSESQLKKKISWVTGIDLNFAYAAFQNQHLVTF